MYESEHFAKRRRRFGDIEASGSVITSCNEEAERKVAIARTEVVEEFNINSRTYVMVP